MTSPEAPTRFVTDTRPLRRYCIRLAVTFLVLLSAATVFGQVRGDRFPAYQDLAISVVIGPATGIVLYGFLVAVARAYPIDVSAAGLTAYGTFTRTMVRWECIVGVRPFSVYGVPYLALDRSDARMPVTVPLWLVEWPRFCARVEEHAGAEHPLSQALRATL